MANALLGMAGVVNDPHENFNVCVGRLDAMQGLCDSIFDREFDSCVLCSNASSALCSRAACRSTSFLLQLDRLLFSCFGSGISGVCSIAGRVGPGRVERLLEVLPWSCGLFLIELIARNAAKKDVDKPKQLGTQVE